MQYHELRHQPQKALVLRAADVDDIVGDDGDGEADTNASEATGKEEEREGQERAGCHHPGPPKDVQGQVNRQKGHLGAQSRKGCGGKGLSRGECERDCVTYHLISKLRSVTC